MASSTSRRAASRRTAGLGVTPVSACGLQSGGTRNRLRRRSPRAVILHPRAGGRGGAGDPGRAGSVHGCMRWKFHIHARRPVRARTTEVSAAGRCSWSSWRTIGGMAKIGNQASVVRQIGRILADKAMCGPPGRDEALPHSLAVAQMRLPPVTPVAAAASDYALSSSSYRSRRITGSTMCDARAPP